MEYGHSTVIDNGEENRYTQQGAHWLSSPLFSAYPQQCRPALAQLLQEVWGYTSWRDMLFYADLREDVRTVSLSQGTIVEQVVYTAEHSCPVNQLLTAPTGAGKSLLFQLPAIYLGREHGLLTLVIEPLKALILDQVESLQSKGYDRVAYASGDLSPEEKAEAYRRVHDGEADILYLSPELLLAYDIHRFIGNRRIGMVVIDEAHTVTTWGREFRVDYWFLGRYLASLKQSLGYHFPLFALTATAVWSPKPHTDMVMETVSSLQMAPCMLYMGTARRENIRFDIRPLTIEEGETYDKAKQRAIAARVEEYVAHHKTLLYFPFAGSLDIRAKSWVAPQSWPYVATYYGKKEKEQKAAIVRAFREGEKRLIVATKAFGMGVDIPDIDRVYHVAPSSTFVDYVQEIGRAGREAEVKAVAATDFHERDFYYMTRLHQVSGISEEQMEMILFKLCELYRMKGRPEEMLVPVSDFEYVVKLPRAKNKLEYESDLGQLVKNALLWIEEDLKRRSGGAVIEVAPCRLLTDCYLQDKTGDAFARRYASYVTPVSGQSSLWRLQTEALWEHEYPELGYREFKQKLMNGTLLEGARAVAVGCHDVLLKEDAPRIIQRVDALFADLSALLREALTRTKGKFDESRLRTLFEAHQLDVRSAKRFIGQLLESRVEEGRSVSYISSARKKESTELQFTVTRGFDLLLQRYRKLMQQYIVGSVGEVIRCFCTPFSDLNLLLNLLSMLGSVAFSVEGGASPCVEIRFLKPQVLEQLAQEGSYRNQVLEEEEQHFLQQIDLYNRFFGNQQLTDTERWNFIEAYFTGRLPLLESES
ncbi:MAG: DEAD/DEAH box helicase [Bacteroides sp.]